MANVTIPYSDGFGRASFEVMDTYLQNFLLNSAEPELKPAVGLKQKVSTTLAQFSVVGLDGNGEVVLANLTGPIKPIGVLAHASVAPGTGVTNAQVWYQGDFNSDMLVWHADYTTDALKAAAFIGSPAPCQILCKKRGA